MAHPSDAMLARIADLRRAGRLRLAPGVVLGLGGRSDSLAMNDMGPAARSFLLHVFIVAFARRDSVVQIGARSIRTRGRQRSS
jgi:hypothetical protein